VNNLRTIHLTSIADLRAASPAWDDLWQRSDVSPPLMRAELLAQWVEHFAPRADFHAMVVADQSQWIAALPLVSCRAGWMIPAGGLPCNSWAPCGDLLCDAAAEENDAAMDMLASATVGLPWHLLWLNDAMPEAPRWQALLRACSRVGMAAHSHVQHRVGRLEIDQDWNAYQKQLPKNHRQAMNRAARRLADEGSLQFEMSSQIEPANVESWLREAFEVENLSWKGELGTSVLRTPGMFDFFATQAEQLARWGQLQTAALRLDGRMLAFMYGYRAKHVCFAHKIGYDPRFAAFSPGQLLFYHVLERFHGDGETRALDFMGPMTQSVSRWRPATYGVGRVVMAPQRLLGRTAMLAYKNVWRRFRHWQTNVGDAGNQAGVPTCGAVKSTVAVD
jgi:CelD/BcsL family acetyltransferase involved in cellulose biosynthesis